MSKGLKRDSSGKIILKKKYGVVYGSSVYHEHQDDETFIREFDDKKEAEKFLHDVNKRRTTDFSDFIVNRRKLRDVA